MRAFMAGFALVSEIAAWSGQQDLNLRPGVRKTPALPGCAMPRTRAAPCRYTVRFCPASRGSSDIRSFLQHKRVHARLRALCRNPETKKHRAGVSGSPLSGDE